ncbi:hypothetical protein JOL79_11595 [Microbispora sp. RL4-1S]|uniref:Uncharacterized protein n=1 Tax=Microbispora oryzae TaxID=2806554 RepID=A0A941AJR2_9ACTN|nr:hypothetical protein [Microbispora oryzae]MBP2704458.1 hypothetical protein [Microbispora oryzae]
MSRWYGRHRRGAARELRELKREEAIARNLRTIFERTAAFRRHLARIDDPRLGR